MGKRQYDRQKHSTKAYDLKKGNKAGKDGWGGALDDYKHAEEEQYEEIEQTEEGLHEEEPKKEAVEEEVKMKLVIEWSAEETSEWVNNVGRGFESIAKEFLEAEIDGSTLFDITLLDMEATFGKGLKTKKIWKEVQNLIRAALEAPPTNISWSYYNQTWKQFKKKDIAKIEQCYQKREEYKMGKWTLCLHKIKPFAKNGSSIRLLKREGESDRPSLETKKPQPVAWSTIVAGGIMV